ncbi:MAG TPA: hypothetical protein VFI68_05990 [Anaerolineales bacterium]|nr:hypothetical protein [Anaerolineales bacterium]
MNLTSKPLAAVILAILFGGIAFTTAMGWWQTESTKQPAVYTEGEFAGQSNPADIRGSYTFGDIENSFGISSSFLAQAFNIQTDDPTAFAIKSLEDIYAASEFEIGTASVRLFVAFYNGLPFDIGTDMYLPENAAALLKERTLTPEQLTYLEAHTVANPADESDSLTPAPTQITETAPEAESTQSAAASEASTEKLIRGKTSFQEILDWGVSQEIIEQIIGGPMPSPLVKVKDHCTENGLDFETIKTSLQAEVDQAQP